MAKPGSGAAQRISNGVPDLGLAKLSDPKAWELQEVYELKAGMRCGGCHRRITVGFHFTSIDPRSQAAPMLRLAACTRDDCEFAEKARDGAAVVEAVEYAWLDENGPDVAVSAKLKGTQFME